MDRCLTALKNQTYKDFEVIIIDDCSIDNSHTKLLEYKASSKFKMKVFKNQKNIGPGETRNFGIENATGEWLAFCDSDDWYSGNFLERMLSKACNVNADIVMCDNNYAFSDGSITRCNNMSCFKERALKQEYVAFAESSLWSLLIKRHLFENIRIPKLYNGEDVAVVPQLLAKAAVITHIKEPLYNYLVRGDSISSLPSPKVYKSMLEAFDIIQQAIEDDYPQECEYIGIRTVLYGATLNAFKAGVDSRTLNEFLGNFYSNYPSWNKNLYLRGIGRAKKIYLQCIRWGLFDANKIYAKLHYAYTQQ